MTLKPLVAACVGILSAASGVRSASEEFITVLSFTVPGLETAIGQIDIADVDGDNFAEVLASDRKKLVLYSVTADQLLIDLDIDSFYTASGLDTCEISSCSAGGVSFTVLLSDVNRDASCDALLLTSNYCSGMTEVQRRYLVTFYDDVLAATPPVVAMDLELESSLCIGLLDAVDVDSDGYPNLIISVDSSVYWEIPTAFYEEETFGKTFFFHLFPDSLIARRDYMITDLAAAKSIVGDNLWLASRSDYYWLDHNGIGPHVTSTGSVLLLDSAGDTLDQRWGNAPWNWCYAWNIRHDHLFRVGCSGDISGTGKSNEVITSLRWRWQCWEDYTPDSLHQDTAGAAIYLVRVSDGDSLEVIWTADAVGHKYETFFFHPDHPGYFFAIEGDTLMRFDGNNGSVVRRYDPLPHGRRFWDYPFGPDRPYLVVVNQDTVTYMAFDIVTDVDATTTSENLPGAFALGQPYPNPFNPEVTVPITMREKTHMKVEVFNALGQRVSILCDRVVSAGEFALVWDGRDFSTGLYFFRATSGGESRTVKTVLVK